MKYIGVIGASKCDDKVKEIAYEVGKEIALAEQILVCGGLSGVMEAAAKGAIENNGTTRGILPGSSKEDANPYIKVAIATGMGEARNAIIAKTCDVLIAVYGEYGTLSEIALGLKMRKKIISLNSWQLSKESKETKDIIKATSPKEAVKLAVL